MNEEAVLIFFDKLKEFVTAPENIAVFAAPLGILCGIAITFVILVSFKRKKDDREFREFVEAQETKTEELPSSEVVLAKVEEEDDDKPQEEEQAAAPEIPSEVAEIKSLDKEGWLSRLRSGLGKTRDGFGSSLKSLFTGQTTINEDLLEEIHEALFKADVGVKTTDHLVNHLRKSLNSGSKPEWDDVQSALRSEISRLLEEPQKPLNQPSAPPWVILVVGVNGVGKTTTIAKLAANFLAEEKSVLLCAADTYRAAAIDQLKVWGERLQVDVIAHQQGSDPAAVTFDGVKAAKSRGSDVLLIDTAGRLHSKTELMDELAKINRVIAKELPDAPHETWLVIDATTGQNAMMQIKAFKEVVDISGLVVTKLDGTAKGGVVIGATNQFQLPIRYIGVGEKASDLRAFDPADYAESLL